MRKYLRSSPNEFSLFLMTGRLGMLFETCWGVRFQICLYEQDSNKSGGASLTVLCHIVKVQVGGKAGNVIKRNTWRKEVRKKNKEVLA